MMVVRHSSRVGFLTLLSILAGFSIASCTSTERPTPRPSSTTGGTVDMEHTPEPTQQHARLRVTNSGDMSVEDLTVHFPESEVRFGDIEAGSTTEYQAVPNGVYGYAAYRFKLNGEVILQPVIDWVGEVPLEGKSFTYVIDFDSSRSQWEMVRLLEVILDE